MPRSPLLDIRHWAVHGRTAKPRWSCRAGFDVTPTSRPISTPISPPAKQASPASPVCPVFLAPRRPRGMLTAPRLRLHRLYPNPHRPARLSLLVASPRLLPVRSARLSFLCLLLSPCSVDSPPLVSRCCLPVVPLVLPPSRPPVRRQRQQPRWASTAVRWAGLRDRRPTRPASAGRFALGAENASASRAGKCVAGRMEFTFFHGHTYWIRLGIEPG